MSDNASYKCTCGETVYRGVEHRCAQAAPMPDPIRMLWGQAQDGQPDYTRVLERIAAALERIMDRMPVRTGRE